MPVSRIGWGARCNDFSIGIELEGCDQLAFEDAQYQALNRLLAELAAALPDRSDGGAQRYRAGTQDRSGSALRLASGS
jgi:hypothetical protein